MKFRFKALERKRQPDQLDSPLLLASPRGWIAVFTVLITTIMIGIWGLLGAVPRAEAADGLLAYPGGITTLESGLPGNVESVAVNQGSRVRGGQTVVTVRTSKGDKVPIKAASDGRVVAVMTAEGRYVTPGKPVLQIEQERAASLEVTLLVSAEMVPYIHIRQTVTMAVPGVNPRTFGRLKGNVRSVSAFPATAGEIATVTGQPASNIPTKPQHLVRVALRKDPSTPSGFEWTSAAGPPITLESRTPVAAELSLGTWKPISILLGD
ncbi:HlyD family efflux transporter periplasmic adaptor subunit [Demetria terragena]|uniref:HlyD family efflux transporter periplasmic adaptor subunit n=1 Tax=Demetria terragena TaxID=63959 RepID=UPI00036F1741|nr:HlyD family efflux transporter periplasmic adaptor subunit [Demetria terragena]